MDFNPIGSMNFGIFCHVGELEICLVGPVEEIGRTVLNDDFFAGA